MFKFKKQFYIDVTNISVNQEFQDTMVLIYDVKYRNSNSASFGTAVSGARAVISPESSFSLDDLYNQMTQEQKNNLIINIGDINNFYTYSGSTNTNLIKDFGIPSPSCTIDEDTGFIISIDSGFGDDIYSDCIILGNKIIFSSFDDRNFEVVELSSPVPVPADVAHGLQEIAQRVQIIAQNSQSSGGSVGLGDVVTAINDVATNVGAVSNRVNDVATATTAVKNSIKASV